MIKFKMYNTDGWSRVEKNGVLMCEGHDKADCYRQIIEWMISHPAVEYDYFTTEWVDQEDWYDKFN